MSRSNAEELDEQRVAECRELLRHFRTPTLLRHNALAQAVLAAAHSSTERNNLLGSVISTALLKLEARERAIIERCDVDRENFEVAARDLGISARHLYRERRRVLEKLSPLLRESAAITIRARSRTGGSLESQLRICRTLEENGAGDLASRMIEHLAGEAPDAEQQVHSLLSIAELHARAGRFTTACEHLNTAGRFANDEHEPSLRVAAQLRVTRAYIFDECGRGQATVLKSAQAARQLLRGNDSYRYDSVKATLLLKALLLCGLSYFAMALPMELGEASEDAAEVYGLLRCPDEEAQMALLFLTSLSSFLCEHNVEQAITFLSEAANIARGCGFTLESIRHQTNLASYYRVQRRPDVAAEMLMSLLPLARDLRNDNVLMAIEVDLANSFVDLHQYERAEALLVEASKVRTENESLRASLLRTSARVHLATKQFQLALDDARVSEVVFAALGKTRLIATPLRLQAAALVKLGDRRSARSILSSAMATPPRTNTQSVLEEALRAACKIKGESVS
ncbi:MAG TPA: hypothetical protein VIW73_13165 [Candidatus Cybelea sp.]